MTACIIIIVIIIFIIFVSIERVKADDDSLRLVWSDEFDVDGLPNPSYWSYDTGDWGWGNQELQDYTDHVENVHVRNGTLIMTARKLRSNYFTSGRLKTQSKVTFRYGRLEARIRIPNLAYGLWPAFWTLGDNFLDVSWPRCGEIDIMEMGSTEGIHDGVVNRRVSSAAHWWDKNGSSYAQYFRFHDTPAILTDGFHNFTLHWTPTEISTYVDGSKMWEMDISLTTCPSCDGFHQSHFILLNMAVGGAYTGLFAPQQITAPMPAYYKIDYVRIYANPWTQLGGRYFTPPSPLQHCGCADCTSTMLDHVASDSAGSFTCRQRMMWVLNNTDYSELQACAMVSRQFPDVCGNGCNPYTCDGKMATITDCGCGDACLTSLDQLADGISCRDRMVWIMEQFGSTENDACFQVSGEYTTICGQHCNPYTCIASTSDVMNETFVKNWTQNSFSGKEGTTSTDTGGSSSATIAESERTQTMPSKLDCGCGSGCKEVLSNLAEGYSCYDRIHWILQQNPTYDERKACLRISEEYPDICGVGCDPNTCHTSTR